MRYQSAGDSTVMRRASLGPAVYAQRRMRSLPIPIRGVSNSRFGTLTNPQGTGSGSGAAAGASTGASIGSVIPVVGTLVGAAIGAIVGAMLGAMGKRDPEDANFQQAGHLYNAQGPGPVLDIPNKYLVLAGLFDLSSTEITGNIPIYKKYGRMGEQKFVNDMMAVIQNAANNGQITANDTPITVMNKVVQPWINSFGFGAMNDPSAGMINTILLGMIAEYVTGGTRRWMDVNGGVPFANASFSLPVTASAAALPATAPMPAASVSAVVASLPAPTNWAAATVNNLPVSLPQLGQPTAVGMMPTGTFVQLPPNFLYAGPSPTGGWLVAQGGQEYSITASGQLQPYAAANATGGAGGLGPLDNAPPQGVTQGVTQAQLTAAVQAALAAGQSAPQAYSTGVSYVGSTGTEVTPAVQQAVANTVQSEIGGLPEWVWLAGGGALLLVLLLRRKGTAS